MKKTILLIDAGYLKQALKNAGFYSDKNTVSTLAKNCHDEKSEELIKILYYDCQSFVPPLDNHGNVKTRYKNPQTNQELTEQPNYLVQQLSQLDLFAIRLGELKFDGWSSENKPLFRQKGVDMRIGLDIAHISHQQNIDRLILITADTDFIPAMKYARKSNIQIILIKLSKNNIHKELIKHSDFVRGIDCSTLQNLTPYKNCNALIN